MAFRYESSTSPGKGHLAQFALKVGAYALRFFQEWFDIPYPASKLDLVAIPDSAGSDGEPRRGDLR